MALIRDKNKIREEITLMMSKLEPDILSKLSESLRRELVWSFSDWMYMQQFVILKIFFDGIIKTGSNSLNEIEELKDMQVKEVCDKVLLKEQKSTPFLDAFKEIE